MGQFSASSKDKQQNQKTNQKTSIQLRERTWLQENYDVIKYIARGEFNQIILVEDRYTREKLIVKRVIYNKDNKNSISNAMRESVYLKQQNSKYIINGKDSHYDRSNKTFYSTMEYANQGNLRDILNKRQAPFNQKFVLKLFKQIAQGIQVLHLQQITHRNIKPSNIFLNKNGKLSAKIGDLEKAININHSDALMHQEDFINSYSAPEIQSDSGYHKSVDIYSLGALLVKLLTFKLQRDSIEGIFPKNINPKLEKLIKSMMNKNQKARPKIAVVYQSISRILKEYKRNSANNSLEKISISSKDFTIQSIETTSNFSSNDM